MLTFSERHLRIVMARSSADPSSAASSNEYERAA
jgi:hypothetical protein